MPGVDGALVTFRLMPPAARCSVPSERAFHALVAKAFSERRKMMRNSMQPLHGSGEVEAALAACGLRPDARAQDLSVEQFARVAWELERMRAEGRGGSGAAAGGEQQAGEQQQQQQQHEGAERGRAEAAGGKGGGKRRRPGAAAASRAAPAV